MNAIDLPSPTTRRPRRAAPLGVVDGLVQASFLIQGILGEIGSEHGLSIIQMRLLGVLRDREPRMAQLAGLLELSRQSATGLIDRAEQRGLVRRVAIPVGDERAVHVELTAEGRQLGAGIEAQVGDRVAAVAAGLSQTGRTRLSALLTQLVTAEAQRRGIDLDPAAARLA